MVLQQARTAVGQLQGLLDIEMGIWSLCQVKYAACSIQQEKHAAAFQLRGFFLRLVQAGKEGPMVILQANSLLQPITHKTGKGF